MKSFLDTMFGSFAGDMWVEWGTFNGKVFTRSGCGRAKDGLTWPTNEAVFYSAALLKRGQSRADQNVEKVMVLTIDDVGTKIDLDAMEMLAPVPTAKVETSRGNFQWQYAIEAGMDPNLYRMLRQEMKANAVWGHSEAIAPSNLIRLPHGVNGKPGKEEWEVVCEITGTRNSPESLIAAFGAPSGQGSGAPASNGKADQVATEGLLYSLVKRIPNNRVERDYWVNVGRAIWGASNGMGHDGFETFDVWSEGWECGANDPIANRVLWDGFTTSTIGRGWLLREAGLGGEAWLREEAKVVFDDGMEHPPEEPDPLLDGEAFRLEDPKKFPRRPWLYGKRLMRGYLSSTVGAGGVGKSALVMAEIIAMVTGKDIIGEKVRAPLRVWLWNGEDDIMELKRRIHGLCAHYGVNDADLGDRLYIDSGREKEIVLAAADGRSTVVNKKVVEAIKRKIKERRIDVLVLDPFVSAHKVSENDNMAIDVVAKTLSRIAEECHCAVDIVHHTRKPGNGSTEPATVDDARGASALINATRHSRVISPMTPSVALKMGVLNPKSCFAIQHGSTKANMVPPGMGADYYHFKNVGLGNDDPFPADGLAPFDEDRVGVVTRLVPPAKSMTNDPSAVITVQDIVAKGVYRADKQADGWVGEVIAEALNIDVGAPGWKITADEVLKEWVKNGWLVVVEKPGPNRHKKPYVEVGNRPEEGNF